MIVVFLLAPAIGAAQWVWSILWSTENNSPPSPTMATTGPITNSIVTQNQTGGQNIVNPIVHDEEGLYQANTKVGNAEQPSVDEAAGIITFGALHFSAYPKPDKPLQFGKFLISCDQMPHKNPGRFVGQLSMMVVGARCTIVGHS